jgi:nucleoside-diphosphate-sugar epimerase
VVHISGIVEERPPEVTFESVNVEGTANLLAACLASGSPRFVFISSLGAERGSSLYHRSKLAAEELVRAYPGEWLVIRPGNVYGPGDEIISLLIRLVRALPIVPVVGDGEQSFQPIYYTDVGRCIAAATDPEGASGETLDVAGVETTSTRDLIERISRIVGLETTPVPVPSIATALATRAAEIAGLEFPLNESKLTMLLEGNVIPPERENALTGRFGIDPVPLDEGLRDLVRQLPVVRPREGVGPLERHAFHADIAGSAKTPEEMIEDFRVHYREILPIDFAVENEPGPGLEEGATVTADIPLRGRIQIRVEELSARRITFATVAGHPLAGVVRFSSRPIAERIRFEIETLTRAGNWIDFLGMKLGGEVAQEMNWSETVRRMVDRSGGEAADGVEVEREVLREDERERIEAWIDRLISERQKERREEQAGTRV